jgi:hypothetical protein
MMISAQTPWVIEQNFANFGDDRLSRVIANLSDDELQLLAVIYTRATANHGVPPRLLDTLAVRLSPGILGRVSRHFGFGAVYEAIIKHAPSKASEFQRHSNPNFMSPGPWSPVPQPAAMRLAKFILEDERPAFYRRTSPTLDYTLYEIYLSYRTAPVGSLTVRAALYETAVFAGSRLVAAYYAGYTVGTALSSLIQVYAPDLHTSIGGGIYTVVDWLSGAWATGDVFTIGQSQQNASVPFSLGSYGYYYPALSDYSITYEWNMMQNGIGGGGCGSRLDGCPILE